MRAPIAQPTVLDLYCKGRAAVTDLTTVTDLSGAKLETLVLGENELNDGDVFALLDRLGSMPLLKEASLDCNELSSLVCCVGLLSASLRELRLDNNQLGQFESTGMDAFAACLARGTSLEELNLEHNQLDDVAVSSLAPALVHLPALRRLFLGFNAFGPVGVHALAEHLELEPELPCRLEELRLETVTLPLPSLQNEIFQHGRLKLAGRDDDHQIGDLDVMLLLNWLCAAPELMELSLVGCSISDLGFVMLGDALCVSGSLDSLEVLHLRKGLQMSHKSLMALAGLWRARGGAALKQLTIRSDDLDGEGLAAVIAAIAGCIIDGLLPELTKLSIGGRSSDEELWDLLPRPTLFALLAALCFGSNLERHFVGHVVCALKRRRAVERLQRAFTRARRARAMAAELNKLCRKVREVEQLEARRESGKELQPNQLTKLAKAAEFRAQLAACFASSSITDATSSATAPTAPSEAAGPAQDQVLPAWQIALLSGAYAD